MYHSCSLSHSCDVALTFILYFVGYFLSCRSVDQSVSDANGLHVAIDLLEIVVVIK